MSRDDGMYWVREQFHRGPEIGRRERHLAATLYNATRRLLLRAERGCVFVPIRSMQYLAALDAEEIVFIDGQGDRSIEFAWQSFHPQVRSRLDEPVPYVCVAYQSKAWQTQLRVHAEFAKALQLLEGRLRRGEPSAANNLLTFRR